eukprot:COSAG01_NODE_1819_length_9156_cov_11.749586_1_plen_1066_part_00
MSAVAAGGVNADSIGYPGPPDRPHGVEPQTAALWKSLGMHVPPAVMRQSREFHESAIQKVLTTIAFKLDLLQQATEENTRLMASQQYVDEELKKVRQVVSSQEAKVLNAARSSAQSGVAAMQRRIDAQNQKLNLQQQQNKVMWEEVTAVKKQLAEEEAAEAAIMGASVDAINLAASEDKMAELFDMVARQSEEQSAHAQSLMHRQNELAAEKDAELRSLKDDIAQHNARNIKNSADREAKLHADLERVQHDGAVMGEAASQQLQQLQGQVNSSDASASAIKELERRLKAEAELHERQGAELAMEAQRRSDEMEQALAAKLDSLAASGGGSTSPEEVEALMAQQQAMLSERASAHREAAALAEGQAMGQVESLAMQLEEAKNRGATDVLELNEALAAERLRLETMQRRAQETSEAHDHQVAEEMARLKEELLKADSSDAIATQMERVRQETAARMEEQARAQEAERASMMQQMAAIQERLQQEQARSEAPAASEGAEELAALKAAMAASSAQLETQLAQLAAREGDNQQLQSEANEQRQAREAARIEALQAQLGADAQRMEALQEQLKLERAAAAAGSSPEAPLSPVGEQQQSGADAERSKMSSRGKKRLQRKVEAHAEIEDLRGRVGGLTLKMSRLTKLLSGIQGAEDFIPFVTKRLGELGDEKADKTAVVELEQRLLDAGVGGGESMGNSLLQMENSIEELASSVAAMVTGKPDMEQVTEATGQAEERLRRELEKHAAELVRVYKSTTERLDTVDETKAEREWIQDLVDRVRRQVGGLKKQIAESSADGGGMEVGGVGGMGGGRAAVASDRQIAGRLDHLRGAMQMFVKGEHPLNWPPSITHTAGNRTVKGGPGQQLVFRAGFPMSNPNVSLPTRTANDPVSGIEREFMHRSIASMGSLSPSAAQELIPRLSSTTDGSLLGRSVGSAEFESATAVMTSDLVDRFRKSIWPPPSIPAFGSWPSAADVMDRADAMLAKTQEFGSTMGSTSSHWRDGDTSGPLAPLSPPRRTKRTSAVAQHQMAKMAGRGPGASPRKALSPSPASPQFATLQVRANGRASAPPGPTF